MEISVRYAPPDGFASTGTGAAEKPGGFLDRAAVLDVDQHLEAKGRTLPKSL
jgi:hypothetical protein